MNRITHAALGAALVGSTVVAIGPSGVGAGPPQPTPTVEPLASGIAGASGSTIGPDGALYVTESDTGRILRIDTSSGDTTVYAAGLPTRIAPIGGPMDVVFKGGTAYVLVSLVGEFFGTDDTSGIYRMDGFDEWTLVADLGQWALDNPPGDEFDWFIPTGVHYSIETFRGGFVVADAHHNKVLYVSPDGTISALEEYGNIVPAGLDTWGRDVLVSFTGPAPHLPDDGVIRRVDPKGGEEVVATGGRLLVDVERGRGATVFGLAQGFFTPGQPDGSPAEPDTGELLIADGDGGFEVVVDGLDRPTSMEIVGTTAYVIGLAGTVVVVDDIAGPPYGGR